MCSHLYENFLHFIKFIFIIVLNFYVAHRDLSYKIMFIEYFLTFFIFRRFVSYMYKIYAMFREQYESTTKETKDHSVICETEYF